MSLMQHEKGFYYERGIAHSGAWGLAAIMVVIASWIFYRYFAPKTWLSGQGLREIIGRRPPEESSTG